jgi:hypothetical protein
MRRRDTLSTEMVKIYTVGIISLSNNRFYSPTCAKKSRIERSNEKNTDQERNCVLKAAQANFGEGLKQPYMQGYSKKCLVVVILKTKFSGKTFTVATATELSI